MNSRNYWTESIEKSAALSPVDRLSEVLFGLIMVLTFTGAISVSTDSSDVKSLLWAALACNFAWGLVDAIMYLMNAALERGHSIKIIRSITDTNNPQEIIQILKEQIPPGFSGLLTNEELLRIGERMKEKSSPQKHRVLVSKDYFIAAEIFLLVFLCTFPVAIPFALMDEVVISMRVSNGIALLMLFSCGFLLAGYAGFRKWITATVYVLLGVVLVALTMALGG